MSLETLQDKIPDTAKDLRLNLSSMLRQTELTEEQLWGTLTACVKAVHSETLRAELLPEAQSRLSAAAYSAAESVAAIMGMNNIYYRFGSLVSNEKYRTMPARLRMSALQTHGIAQANVELWSLAVSAINGCGTCVEAHERNLREQGLSEESILAAVRLAAVLHGLSCVVA